MITNDLVGIVSIGDLSRVEAIKPEDSGEVLASTSDPSEESSKSGKKSY